MALYPALSYLTVLLSASACQSALRLTHSPPSTRIKKQPCRLRTDIHMLYAIVFVFIDNGLWRWCTRVLLQWFVNDAFSQVNVQLMTDKIKQGRCNLTLVIAAELESAQLLVNTVSIKSSEPSFVLIKVKHLYRACLRALWISQTAIEEQQVRTATTRSIKDEHPTSPWKHMSVWRISVLPWQWRGVLP